MFNKLTLVLVINLTFVSVVYAQQQQEEKLTITTYYPSPYGSYNELRSKRMAMGDTYYDSAKYCWADSCTWVGDFYQIPPIVDLIVEGYVAFGKPLDLLIPRAAPVSFGTQGIVQIEYDYPIGSDVPSLFVKQKIAVAPPNPLVSDEVRNTAIVAESVFGSGIVAKTWANLWGRIPENKKGDLTYILDNLAAGVKGKSTADSGIGVAGITSRNNSIAAGGATTGDFSYGLIGYSLRHVGVYGRTDAPICAGAAGSAGTFAGCTGVQGVSSASVFGPMLTAGVVGVGFVAPGSPSTGRMGVYGFTDTFGGIGVGGLTIRNDSYGVVGYNSVEGTGVYGVSMAGGVGVVGQSVGTGEAGPQGNYGVHGKSEGGHGVYGEAQKKVGVVGYSDGKGDDSAGVYGASNQPNRVGVKGEDKASGGIGVLGNGGKYGGYFTGYLTPGGIGVYGEAAFTGGAGGYFKGSGCGSAQSPAVYLDGRVTLVNSCVEGGDVAEDIDCPNCAAFEVVVIDSEHNQRLKRSTTAYDPTVAGVISEQPLLHITNSKPEERKETTKPLALVGQVKCKVTTENGPIKRGDLLVTSSKAGYAMRADIEKLKPGMLIGKALEPLEKGEGQITVLITGS